MLNQNYDNSGTKSSKKSYLDHAMDAIKGRYTVENVPPVLAKHPIWVVWKSEPNSSGKMTKPPYQVTGKRASTDNSETWASLSSVIAAYERGGYAGIGFVITPSTGIVPVDLDHIIDRETGKTISPWAVYIIEKLSSYSEFSPSGDGLHILCEGTLPVPGGNDGFKGDVAKIEMYSSGRYFTYTGDVMEGYGKIQKRDEELLSVYEFMRGRKKIESEPPPSGGNDGQPFVWDNRIDSLPLKEATKALILIGVPKGERSEAIMSAAVRKCT